MELRCKVIVLLTTIISFKEVHGAVKKWTGDWIVDWENPNNWLEGRVPESDDFIVFPAEMRHAVGLPNTRHFRFSGIQFPANGFVALPENGRLIISSMSSDQSIESRWRWEMTFLWVEPRMWNVTNEAVPYLERLPCQNDIVVLPKKSEVFSVRLPASRNLEVQSVRLADKNTSLTRWEWSEMRDRTEFLDSRFTIEYSPINGCENCPCQEGDITQYWEEICDVVRPRCEIPACEYPLTVEGHCCYYCGGRITLSAKALLSAARKITDRVLSSFSTSVYWHTRITSTGHKEILVTERNRYAGVDVILALDELKTALKEQSIEILLIENSGDPLDDNRLAYALGPFLGGFLAIICLTLLICILFGYSFSQIWEATQEIFTVIFLDKRVNGSNYIRKKSFSFARFENVSEGNVHLGEETHHPITSGERFENPLYRSIKRSKGQDKKSLDLQKPVSLAALQRTSESDNTEEIEMDIENL
ncbi:protein amnionless [Phymastichus coffea]|uniref:protein amnionless n=1 Tax=Phymastichus coffea TaxID=108790 RepID=UPI00273B1C16|nr:protein amnionless [Phymastichus coffea]